MEDYGLNTVIISDQDRNITKLFKGTRMFGSVRVTYLIDERGVITAAQSYVLGVKKQARNLLRGIIGR